MKVLYNGNYIELDDKLDLDYINFDMNKNENKNKIIDLDDTLELNNNAVNEVSEEEFDER